MSDRVGFEGACVPVPAALVAAHRTFWARMARPGSHWSGAARVAIAAETRSARDCELCHARKQALSASMVQGDHSAAPESKGVLPDVAVEAVHRIITDAARLGERWLEGLYARGLSDGQYVELLGIAVATLSVDEVCRLLGAPTHPLPRPEPGEPSGDRPERAVKSEAWVPMLPGNAAVGDEADLWPTPRTGNVVRALSLVPDAVRDLKLLSEAHYLAMEDVPDPTAQRTLTRPQIELVAGRVSAMNECFY